MRGRVLVPGQARGTVLASEEPLSFWGGYDQKSGEIIDRRHPLSGHNAAGCILAIPGSRGSSTTTAVFLESVRRGTAPAAVVVRGTDTFLMLASVVADEMYRKPVPVLVVGPEDFARLRTGQTARIGEDGSIEIEENAGEGDGGDGDPA